MTEAYGGASTQPEMAFPVHNYEEDDGTDSDTSSDDGNEDIEAMDVSNLTEEQAAEAIYMAYRKAKRHWRRFTGKPVRKFRRHFRRHQYSKGKGRGKGRGFFFTHDDMLAYLKGKRQRQRQPSPHLWTRLRSPKESEGSQWKHPQAPRVWL